MKTKRKLHPNNKIVTFQYHPIGYLLLNLIQTYKLFKVLSTETTKRERFRILSKFVETLLRDIAQANPQGLVRGQKHASKYIYERLRALVMGGNTLPL